MGTNSTETTTTAGIVRGIKIGNALIWRGIPYAKAPIGDLRFLPPVSPSAWDGVRDASLWGSKAMQVPQTHPFPGLGTHDPRDPTSGGTPGTSEDCLFINVTAPAETPSAGAPVLVWIHGGGYVSGSGADLGDGLKFAQRDGLVFVSFNYRLGALGFLNLAPLLGDRYRGSGNAGLLDQIAALRWVRANIAAFGGDPSQVTIAGVSAGGKSVVTLMTAPAARGLFSRAISQSGGGDRAASGDVTVVTAEELIALLNLASPADVLEVPGLELVKAAESIGGLGPLRDTWVWMPTVDGEILPDLPIDAIKASRAEGISLMVGSNSNEAATYVALDPDAASSARSLLRNSLGDGLSSKIISSYMARRPEATAKEIDQDIMTDERYGVAALRLADAQSVFAPTYRYYFTAGLPGLPAMTGGHGIEVAFVFGLLPKTYSPTDELVRVIGEYWASFISSGKPAAADAPEWPSYNPGTRPTMILEPGVQVVNDPTADRHNVWKDVIFSTNRWYQLESE